MTGNESDSGLMRKVWKAGWVLALIVILVLLAKATFSVLLLVFAGALIAIFFRGFGRMICRWTGWKSSYSLVVAVVFTFLFIAGLLWLIGAKVAGQTAELSETLPATVENVKRQLNSTSWGRSIVEKASSPESIKKAKEVVDTLFKSTFGVFGDLYVVIIIGIFFTVSPNLYSSGFLKLVPKKSRSKTKKVLQKIAGSLEKWLKGKIFAMFVVFVLTAIGLLILGLPMWLALALLAGALNFIPNFGPLIAMIPAVLVASMQGFTTALIVAGLYILIQVLESNFITPTVQRKLINIPPALIIIAQLLISPFSGGWGLVLATPLMVILMVILQHTWVQRNRKTAQDS